MRSTKVSRHKAYERLKVLFNDWRKMNDKQPLNETKRSFKYVIEATREECLELLMLSYVCNNMID